MKNLHSANKVAELQKKDCRAKQKVWLWHWIKVK